MDIKKLLVLCVFSCFLVACGNKDEAYYLEHIDKAEEKMSDCEKQIMKALGKNDEDAINKIESNIECQSAEKAIRENQRREWEKEKQEKEAKEKAELAEAKDALDKEYGQQTWQEYIATYANSDCANRFSFGKDSKCQAMKEMYEDKVQQGEKELSQIPFEKLSLDESYCKQDKRQYSVCQVWKETTEKQEKDIVSNYVKNHEALKTDYNQCVDKLIEAEKQSDSWQLIANIRDSYPCQQTVKARMELQLGYQLTDEKME